jgi:glycosyltransferase involved in cell wall biosynthesis
MGCAPINQMSYSALITFFNSPNPNLAIDSALAQTIKPHEIILVDDCSMIEFQLNLQRLANEYGCVYMRTPTNLGPAGARNFGIQAAHNDIIMIFDDDDVSLPHRAKIHIESLESGSQLSYVSSRKIYPNDYSFEAINENYFGEINPFDLSRWLLIGVKNHVLPKIHVPACCLAFRKDFFMEDEIFDGNFRRLEDVDFALRASEKGMIFSFSEVFGVLRYASNGSDKSAVVESTAQIQILSKYKMYLAQNEFSQMKKWYEIRSYYFSRNYAKLIVSGILFTLRFGLQWRRLLNGLSRIMHDFRKASKGNLGG